VLGRHQPRLSVTGPCVHTCPRVGFASTCRFTCVDRQACKTKCFLVSTHPRSKETSDGRPELHRTRHMKQGARCHPTPTTAQADDIDYQHFYNHFMSIFEAWRLSVNTLTPCCELYALNSHVHSIRSLGISRRANGLQPTYRIKGRSELYTEPNPHPCAFE
jgi:hypothetical protein